jgi:hypothetical protein
MKNTIFISFFFFLLIGGTCNNNEEKHNSILFKNNSDKDLYVHGKFEYPDTSIDFSNPVLSGEYYKVISHSTNDPLEITDTYEGRFIQYDTLMVFVFDAETLENTPWDTITANYIILMRFDLSLEDLKRLNWTITYPAMENMQVKIYP